ncbi:uncharacterized protein YbjT (DUF2867 family) [Nocardiopsis sp. Huas11]|uniref:NAD(P)H-binding protein n=1 Tax=Nocardiopsis sp. Huas11 TaxID=2183912 RepID=UPI000EAB63F0|nr:NAD(P)H-binding protein [Nocardiopsis sp. Huas11]RKS07164.1 uncharacterized protein YbjT (DUF2867 family) [Nocardiopsis sp. Huas11]
MDNAPVLVIGATGKTGRKVTARLREQGIEVRAASRSGETRFDWADQSTWKPALEGVERMYVVPLDAPPSRTPELVQAAEAAGVRRLVLLSARGVDVPDYFGTDTTASGLHLAGERAVRESGLEWTILRPSWFAQNFTEGDFRDAIVAGELALPAGDGRAAFVDTEDIAAVAVAALTEDGHAGQVYELTGPRAVGLVELLDEIGRAAGIGTRYVPVGETEFQEALVAEGVSPAEAKLWSDALHAIRTSGDAVVADGVRRALGREPRDVADVVRDEAARGAWQG